MAHFRQRSHGIPKCFDTPINRYQLPSSYDHLHLIGVDCAEHILYLTSRKLDVAFINY